MKFDESLSRLQVFQRGMEEGGDEGREGKVGRGREEGGGGVGGRVVSREGWREGKQGRQ